MIEVRCLERGDWKRGYVELLKQLTVAPSMNQGQFEKVFEKMYGLGDDSMYETIVAVDTDTDRIIGAASAIYEMKFARGGCLCAHIEDVVVDSDFRGAKLGWRLIDALIQSARKRNCYKIILDCAEENVGFYQKCGFQRKEVQMALYLDR
eukprot:CAMPEP_0182443008 /NCGR_PEP_ID=MMETSP1172-20130603/1857_1 /TAXON_ID=708627 /ORGANISM="Timspurckia oligopyrenoides, Strain CCMP3278" /LENGTH=149 /DNA_ID=CAMNT_0024638143 /DNA_START=68 /DNA_END=517 /DNA_ORIENTATION=-